MKNLFRTTAILATISLLTACTPPAPTEEPAADEGGAMSEPAKDADDDAKEDTDEAMEDDSAMSEDSEGEDAAKDDEEMKDEDDADDADQPAAVGGAAGGAALGADVTASRVIEMTVEDWKFTPDVITVEKGEKVSLKVTALTGTHGIAIPGLSINETVAAGETITIEIPSDVAGTFDFFCSVPCGKGHKEMKGAIVVE